MSPNPVNTSLKPIDTFQLNKGFNLKDRWEISQKIGQGAFGQTYTAFDKLTSEHVAVKIEPLANKKQVLKVEVTLLRKLQDTPYVARYIGCGRQDDFNFMAMELLGKNISELRKKRYDHCFSLATTALLAKQMLGGIQAIHDHGYLHRDVKPVIINIVINKSNFVMGLRRSTEPSLYGRSRCYIIDFGLSRRHMDNNNQIREPRETAGFRGTARYASIASHQNKELGRKDDLWSLFYIILECLTGGLPWRREKEKEKIGEMKMKLHTPELVEKQPAPLLEMMKYLDSLQYADRPNYSYLNKLVDNLFELSNEPPDIPYDWERPSPLQSVGSFISTAGVTSSHPGRRNLVNTSNVMGGIVTTATANNGRSVQESTSHELSERRQMETGAHRASQASYPKRELHLTGGAKTKAETNEAPDIETNSMEKKKKSGLMNRIFTPKPPNESPPKRKIFARGSRSNVTRLGIRNNQNYRIATFRFNAVRTFSTNVGTNAIPNKSKWAESETNVYTKAIIENLSEYYTNHSGEQEQGWNYIETQEFPADIFLDIGEPILLDNSRNKRTRWMEVEYNKLQEEYDREKSERALSHCFRKDTYFPFAIKLLQDNKSIPSLALENLMYPLLLRLYGRAISESIFNDTKKAPLLKSLRYFHKLLNLNGSGSFIYSEAMKRSSSPRAYVTAKDFIYLMLSEGIEPSINEYNVLLQTLINSQRLFEAKKLYFQLESRQLVKEKTIEIMVKAFCDHGNYQVALTMMKEYLQRNGSLNYLCIRYFMGACTKANDIQTMEEFIEVIKPLDDIAVDAIGDALCQSHKSHIFVRFLNKWIAEESPSAAAAYCCLIAELIHAKEYEKAKKTLDFLNAYKVKTNTSNPSNYNTIIEVALARYLVFQRRGIDLRKQLKPLLPTNIPLVSKEPLLEYFDEFVKQCVHASLYGENTAIRRIKLKNILITHLAETRQIEALAKTLENRVPLSALYFTTLNSTIEAFYDAMDKKRFLFLGDYMKQRSIHINSSAVREAIRSYQK
ncbi:Protein kinase, ATP binding site domain-containing protein [Rozella allomycis CSF55]|uniref:Protein kinase, ATP binding site domain-containing protein n=1 Tax=Rozella allomycis (strain CSF55) TaxID=988480 RepID=A0A075B545_ROZAC|nr:Protein kinase, ATP binding site domain-containing protein [Rozella allomycis CSF55]|eukprot:EPZ36733.1 Protein kinase, ATP binding site domain-containing protein [Rozella allomycis CSF55]